MKRTCKQCGADISGKDKRSIFCNRSCAAVFNNKVSPKRRPHSDKFCNCGKRKSRKSQSCHACKLVRTRNERMNKTLGDTLSKGNARVKYSHVRYIAKHVMLNSGIESRCRVCNFSSVVEVCHLKPISSFSLDAKISEVNSLSNMVYLCPNHHAMLDLGLLSLL